MRLPGPDHGSIKARKGKPPSPLSALLVLATSSVPGICGELPDFAGTHHKARRSMIVRPSSLMPYTLRLFDCAPGSGRPGQTLR